MEKKLYEGIFTIDSFLLSPLLSSTPLYVYLVKKKITSPNPSISIHWKIEKHFTIV